ncbi:MAG: hypothetical protein NXI09_15695 [Bacteroidetes bacterium]|nr:hypothetical protein [Bacteroidota bacterium]
MVNAKQKFLLTIVGFSVLLFLSYQLSIRKALLERLKFKNFQEQGQLMEGVKERMFILNKQNAQLASELGGQNLIDQGFEEALLEEIGSFSANSGIQLIDFNEKWESKEESFRIETIKVVLKGEFASHLRLLHHLETEFKTGTVVSVDMELKKNPRNNKQELFQTLYIQKLFDDEA